MSSAWDNLMASFEESSFAEKISLCNTANAAYDSTESIWRNGYVRAVDRHAVRHDSGEYYVYSWKHLMGLPFYVGSGKGDRWTQKNNRCGRFYTEIDAGDAVVYKIACGLDAKMARFIERYLSLSIELAGMKLANGDNCIDVSGVDGAKRWIAKNDGRIDSELIKRIEFVFMNNVLNDEECRRREVIEIRNFRNAHGDKFFSDRFAQ